MSRARWVPRLLVLAALGAAVAAVAAGVPAVFVFGPLLGLLILRIGLATFDSLEAGGDHIPDSEPRPVDPREERTTYACDGCGAQVLLVVRGTPVPPRHCGERMAERRELPGRLPGSLR